jgi:hypothetical protein
MRSGWQAWYSGAGFEKNTGGGQSVLGAGTSYHLSSLPRANATLSFYGARPCRCVCVPLMRVLRQRNHDPRVQQRVLCRPD